MEYDVDICQLSQSFYSAYPSSIYPEIMAKDSRPYTCLMIETQEDYLICIPFRSSVLHNDAFIFSNTKRSQKTRSGLDYSKTVIVKDTSYIDSNKSVVVDNDEYTAMMTNIEKIVSGIYSYITKYVQHVTGVKTLHPREFARHYQYSTLPYFHDILGIDQETSSSSN